MEFDYVVKREEKGRICFGSGMERKTLTSDVQGLYSRHARTNMKENFVAIMPGMYEASDLNSAFGPLMKRPTSKLGTVIGGRTATVKDIASTTPPPGAYDPTFHPTPPCQKRAPFNSKTKRVLHQYSDTPGVGQYVVTPPKCRSIPFAHSFGGKKTVLPAVKIKCGPFIFDTCERCNTFPEGDYWELDFKEAQRPQKKKGGKADIIKEGIFLCRPCYNIEKSENKIFSKGQIRAFKKIRNCSKIHFHGGCKGKLYLVPPEEIKKLRVREGYLSLFYK